MAGHKQERESMNFHKFCQLRNAYTFVDSTRRLFPWMFSKLQKPRAG